MKEIEVYADWFNLPEVTKIGTLRAEVSKGSEVFSFEYTSNWLQSKFARDIDPDLKLFAGRQYLNDDKPNYGLFLDSSPDRWGRILMQRREAIEARKTNQQKKRLIESDYLLGVDDKTRMGALRFKLKGESDFLANNTSIETPPFTSIRELEQASLRYENDDFFKDEDSQKWLTLLIAPGSSLGGARPKASVVDPDGHFWIAKFPSKNDQNDSGAWEAIVNELASELGIRVAQGSAKIYSQRQHTYLTKRFDRTETNKRIHFASALSLLGFRDGYSHKEGGSYLELVDLINEYSCLPTEDVRELWKRIVFSVAVSNTDDHLRNHGFLLTENGWRLSPAYDINPNDEGLGLSLNISADDNSLDFDLCRSVCEQYRWHTSDADVFIKEVIRVVGSWREKAKRFGISNAEQVAMEFAFKV